MMVKKGVSFNDIHSFDDLDLILSSVEIPPAQAKTTFIDIPGGDGSIDLTEAHGEVKYSDRDCKFAFTMNPAGDLSESAFEEKKTEVSNLLNGLACKITLDKDDEYYYLGRCFIDAYQSNKRIRQIVVSAKVKPYKFKQNETVIKIDLTNETKEINITNGRKSVVPIFEASEEGGIVTFGAVSYALEKGSQKILGIQFKEGANKLKVSGTGMLALRYQEGDL